MSVSPTHDICALTDLAPGSATRFDVAGRAVAVVRIGDDVYAIGDTCSHADVSLSEGEVWCDEKELECWKHGSTFSLVTGEPSTLPATQPVPVFVASVVDGRVHIEIETVQIDRGQINRGEINRGEINDREGAK